MKRPKEVDDAWIERCAKYLLESHAIKALGGRHRLTYEELEALGLERGRTLDFEDMRAELAKIERLASDAEKPTIALSTKFVRGKMDPYLAIEHHVEAARRHLTQAIVELRLADNVIRNEMPDRGSTRYTLQRSAVRLAMALFPADTPWRDVRPVAEAIIKHAARTLPELEIPSEKSMRNWFNAEREAESGKRAPEIEG